MANAALILGIVTCVLVIIPGYNFIALITGIVGVVLSVSSLKNLKEANLPTGAAKAGLITSIVGLSLAALLYLTCILCMAGTTCVTVEGIKSCSSTSIPQDANVKQKGAAPQKSK